jgi:hypothetical protein
MRGCINQGNPRQNMPRDFAKAAPKNAKVIFENDRIRVVELSWKQGLNIPMHSHPANFVYAITPLRYKSTSPGGKAERRSLKTGGISWSDGESHAVEVLGEVGRALVVELK